MPLVSLWHGKVSSKESRLTRFRPSETMLVVHNICAAELSVMMLTQLQQMKGEVQQAKEVLIWISLLQLLPYQEGFRNFIITETSGSLSNLVEIV